VNKLGNEWANVVTIWDVLDDVIEFCKKVSKLNLTRVVEGMLAVVFALVVIRYVILPLLFR
jgi:hypothetical protein